MNTQLYIKKETDDPFFINEKNGLICKAVLIGEPEGKRNLIENFYKTFKLSFFKQPLGGDFVTKEIYLEKEQSFVNIQIWDTTGQEQFKSIGKSFYRNTDVFLLVYVKSEKTTFESIKKFWYKEVINYASDNTIFVLVGYKDEMIEYEEVSEEEGKAYAKKINAIFKETDNIEDVFHIIAQNIKIECLNCLKKNKLLKKDNNIKKKGCF